MAGALERERLRIEDDSRPTNDGLNWAVVCKRCGLAVELRSGYSWPRCPSCGGPLVGIDDAGELAIEPWGDSIGRRPRTLADLQALREG